MQECQLIHEEGCYSCKISIRFSSSPRVLYSCVPRHTAMLVGSCDCEWRVPSCMLRSFVLDKGTFSPTSLVFASVSHACQMIRACGRQP